MCIVPSVHWECMTPSVLSTCTLGAYVPLHSESEIRIAESHSAVGALRKRVLNFRLLNPGVCVILNLDYYVRKELIYMTDVKQRAINIINVMPETEVM